MQKKVAVITYSKIMIVKISKDIVLIYNLQTNKIVKTKSTAAIMSKGAKD